MFVNGIIPTVPSSIQAKQVRMDAHKSDTDNDPRQQQDGSREAGPGFVHTALMSTVQILHYSPSVAIVSC